jgi:hypothetical protein
MKTCLSPTARLAQVLRSFCAPDDALLAYPFIAPGLAGASPVVTVATDGATACFWVAGRVGPYKDYAALGPFGKVGESPLGRFRKLFRPGGLYPLSCAKRAVKCYQAEILGSMAVLRPEWVQVLACCDSCYLGAAAAVDYRHVAISVSATLEGKVLRGVLICPEVGKQNGEITK